MAGNSYWNRQLVSRRKALQGAAAAGGGLAALSLVGCGSDDNGKKSGGSSSEALDSTKGVPGGTARIQFSGDAGGLSLVRLSQTSHIAGYSHSGLLEYKNGRPLPGIDGSNFESDPDLAQAMPEQPDPTTFIFKLRDAKFHNGRKVVSEDVRYSFDRYTNWPESSARTIWEPWFERVDTPDPTTAVVKTKRPDADSIGNMTGHRDAHILAKEHEESPEADKRLMGSGAFIMDQYTPPVLITFKKNPDYFNKPYPYFDRLEVLGMSDPQKRVADIISGQTHVPFYTDPEPTAQILAARNDLQKFVYGEPAANVHLRTDKPPFNDKRVRQAFSMAMDRKKIRDAVSAGLGEVDQNLSSLQTAWGFRKPAQLGQWAKHWEYNPAEAKKLMVAAGYNSPLETEWTHWDNTRTGQAFVDHAVLAIAGYRETGIANIKEITITSALYNTTLQLGIYEGMHHAPGGTMKSAQFAKDNYGAYWSPATGALPAPTRQVGFIFNPKLNTMLDAQIGQFKFEERKATWRGIEELLAEEMYKLQFSTSQIHYFADPKLKNVQRPWWGYAGSWHYVKYWWFENGKS